MKALTRRFHLGTRAAVVLAAVVSPFVPVRTATAATKPSVTWKVTSLQPSTTTRASSLIATNSKGKQKWSAKGDCFLTDTTITSRASGVCTVVVTISAKSPYAARTVRKRLPIATRTIVPASFDPYAGTSPAVAAAGTRTEGTLVTPDGRTRRYRTYAPSGLTSGTRVPLVIALHGGLGTSSQFEDNSGIDGLAESNRFIAVLPDGVGNQADGSGYQTWNGGYCCGPAAAQSVDDVAFIRSLVSEMFRKFPIDKSRIYAMGHSNGGILSYKLACELSDVVVAIGVQAGSNVVAGCQPANPVSVFHLHGTSDSNMPINGGKGSGVSATTFVSARSAVDAMAAVDGCNVSSPSTLVTSSADVTALSWTACRANTEVRFVSVNGATHAWMGHAAQTAGSSSYVGEPYPSLDATRAILSFLLSKSR